MPLTNQNSQSKNHRRNEGAITLLVGKLKVELLKRIDEGFHGEVNLHVEIVGGDITECSVGSMARTKLK